MLAFFKGNKVKTKAEKKAHKQARTIRKTKNNRWTTKEI